MQSQINVADIDSQLQRRSRDQDLEFAVLELALGVQPQLAGQAAMGCSHHLSTHALSQVKRNTLSQSARVYKNQRRAVLLDQFTNAVVNLVPTSTARNRPKFLTGDFDCKVHLPLVADIGHHTIRTIIAG